MAVPRIGVPNSAVSVERASKPADVELLARDATGKDKTHNLTSGVYGAVTKHRLQMFVI